MAILEKLIISGELKAKSVMKIDIVKPIPPKNPAPKIVLQFKSFGNVQRLNEIPKNENKTIPKGLPITNPKIIPRLTLSKTFVCQSAAIGKAVFAKANIGSMKKATGL